MADTQRAGHALPAEANPVVSVVVATRNRAALLGETVSSILGQTFRSLELIVVSDGSTDETRSVIESFADPRIVFVELPHAGRPSVPRNRGIALARGRFVAFCDDDDTWHREKLARQVALMESTPAAGLCYTNSVALRNGQIGETSRIRPGALVTDFGGLVWTNTICTSSAMVRREVFDAVGLLDEDPRLCPFDDYELWLRIAHRFPVLCLDEPLVIYRIHELSIVARFAERELIVIRALRSARGKLRSHGFVIALSIALRLGKHLVSALRGHEYRIR